MANDAEFLLDVTRLVWRRWVGRQATGVDRVCLAYLEHLGARSQAVVQHRRYRRILSRAASEKLFGLLADPTERFRADLVLGALRFGAQSRLPGKGRLYLNIGHTGLNDPGFRNWVNDADLRPVYFVHDLIPIAHPEYCRAGERERHIERMRTVLATAAGVIGNSRATLDDLTEFGRLAVLPQPPASAAWLGTIGLPPAGAHKDPDRPTFVTLGTIEARKNHLLLLRVWASLVEKRGSLAPRLLVIGQRGWEAEAAIDLLDRRALGDAVIEIRGCDDAELARHLRSARALLFPSFAEGFGMPLMEAFQASVPAIVSDLPVFREIGQGVPEMLDVRDEKAWERAIMDYATDNSAARKRQLDRLASFRAPTWEDHFAKVGSWLKTL